jgi:transcriptional regulator GlxA family with amidase domain
VAPRPTGPWADRPLRSTGHFARLFIAETGTTPARFVERARVEAARDLLEAGHASVETVAEQAGFGSAETMRRAFLRVRGVGPADYRARFGATHLHSLDERQAS